ncbi:CheR family methyltransferase [Brevibacillus dissolubilis]|uniref:CheR family methyltransferase n=1 Tax=Brevibacillus dissolubilis TaxID=1844116 RepID=UPI001117126C|nr:protein-glutamate O-methyltransferase CheR [Brevibacillus dissolubilis]
MNQEELETIEIELLLEGIYRYYGFDFRNYAVSSIRRRIWHRIRAERLTSISGLQERVLHDARVMEQLLADFSINVTEMFRDPGFFLAFRQKVVPILRDYPFIRIWHAGCSTGQEVYSMAILLHEEGLFDRTRLYATDMNEHVLRRAKTGTFPLDKMQLYTKNYLAAGGTRAFSEYYTVKSDQAIFEPFLGDNIVFAQHNLATDRSFNEFHVIICRNVMIYFDETLQNRVHDLFYDSLCMSGFFGLGNREGVVCTSHANDYEEVDGLEKIYRKVR